MSSGLNPAPDAAESSPAAGIPDHVLANGVRIPMFGLGMDQVRDVERGYGAVRRALAYGYRSIDTATSYGNEEVVGRAVRESGLPRSTIFVTTKVRQADQGYDRTLRAFDRSLRLLGFEYLDSYLVHWPGKYQFVATWRALERLYRDGRVRTIGVCNFNPHHLERLAAETDITPMVNQIEWHPYFAQPAVAAYCADHHILIEAWSPLMCGGVVLEDPTVLEIAAELGRSSAQVILKWHLQQDRRVFPKSVTPARIDENIALFDFSLSAEQMAAIDGLAPHDTRIGPDPDVFFDN
jgi:diketogulonate reductase-like aldo/keto reductase